MKGEPMSEQEVIDPSENAHGLAALAGRSDLVASSEVDQQIRTAKAFPRSIEKFERNLLTHATRSQEVAQQCFYAVPRAGKLIEGPSVRMAEIAASAWQNLRIGARIVAVEDDPKNAREGFVIVEGAVIDLENNVAFRAQVRRRVYRDRKGRLDVEVASMAGQSIALRNAIFRAIPRALMSPIEEQVRRIAKGKDKPLEEVRAKCLEFLKKLDLSDERICSVVGKPSVKDIDHDDVYQLRTLAQSIYEGSGDVDALFPEPAKAEEGAEKKSAAQEKIETAKAEKAGGKKGEQKTL